MTRTDKAVYLQEAAGLVARVWVLNGAKPGQYYTYVDHRWVMVTIGYNGEEAAPRRRQAEKESDFLAADERKAATRKRLEDLTSDRSIDA